METVEIQVRNPAALWHEIEELIQVHNGVDELMPFMKRYPEVYHIYLQLDSEIKGEETGNSKSSQ